MEKIKITKSEGVELIIADIVNTIESGERIGQQLLNDILMYGYEGWTNATSIDIEEELNNRFEKEYQITN